MDNQKPIELDPLALYVIEQVAEGRTLIEIGAELGMTGGSLFSRVSQNSELQRRYWLAKEASTEKLEAELMEAARITALTNPKAARVQLAGLQWIISKRCPKRYAERLDLTSSDASMSPKEAAPASAALPAELVAALIEKLTD